MTLVLAYAPTPFVVGNRYRMEARVGWTVCREPEEVGDQRCTEENVEAMNANGHAMKAVVGFRQPDGRITEK